MKHGVRFAIVSLGLFLVSLASGLGLVGYYHERQLAETERIQQEQAYERQTEALRQQEEDIRRQQHLLEEEREALEEQKWEMERSAAQAQGRSKQLDEERKGASRVRQIWDQVTGKEEERRQAQQANEDIRDQAQRGAQEIQKSIEQAGEMIAVLNERMQDLEHMKEQAREMQETAESTYTGNQETIQKIISYLAAGAAWIKEHW